MQLGIFVFFVPAVALFAQEANSGFDLRATVTGEATYSRERAEPTGGFRSVFYPTWKFGEHWSVSGAVEIISRPFYIEDLSRPSYGVMARVPQATIGYSQVWKDGSLSIRVGRLPSAFGAFLLRYDDASNAVSQGPPGYGYYGGVVSSLGLTGAQLDATAGKWDARLQLVNSSAANPRSVFQKDQYANWAGGVGFTVFQGLRVGVSGYRGPYLDRQSPFYFPGEARPRDLPATAAGSDVEWARGHWNLYGEWQHVEMAYRAIPVFKVSTAYGEVKRVLGPRWYVAARVGAVRNSIHFDTDTSEATVGFRPGARQVVKLGCVIERDRQSHRVSPTLVVQMVSNFHPLSIAWR